MVHESGLKHSCFFYYSKSLWMFRSVFSAEKKTYFNRPKQGTTLNQIRQTLIRSYFKASSFSYKHDCVLRTLSKLLNSLLDTNQRVNSRRQWICLPKMDLSFTFPQDEWSYFWLVKNVSPFLYVLWTGFSLEVVSIGLFWVCFMSFSYNGVCFLQLKVNC